MLNTKQKDITVFQNTKELFLSSDFNSIVEKLCTDLSKEDSEFDYFLHKHFNHEGYADIWRIPLLLLDLYNSNFAPHRNILYDIEFACNFNYFIDRLYKHCVSEYELYPIENLYFKDLHANAFLLKSKQQFLKLYTETFDRIGDNMKLFVEYKKEVV